MMWSFMRAPDRRVVLTLLVASVMLGSYGCPWRRSDDDRERREQHQEPGEEHHDDRAPTDARKPFDTGLN